MPSFAAAWITQRQQANVQLLLQEKARGQELYKQFIEEASKLYIDALIHDQVAVPPLVNLFSSISKMRVVSNPGIPEQADKVIRMIVNSYFSPNKTLPEPRAMVDMPRFRDADKVPRSLSLEICAPYPASENHS